MHGIALTIAEYHPEICLQRRISEQALLNGTYVCSTSEVCMTGTVVALLLMVGN
jgi:hypothetical protein